MAQVAGTGGPDIAAMIEARIGAGASVEGSGSGQPLTIRLGGSTTRPLHVDSEGGVHGTITTKNAQSFSTIQDAINSFFLMDDAYRQKVMDQLYFYGLTDGSNNEAQAVAAWEGAVRLAWQYRQAGKSVDPLDMLPRMTNLKAGQLGNQPRVIRQRSVNLTDPAEAKAFIRQAFQASMGRDPHDAEIRSMMRAIAAGEKQDPTVSTTTTDPNGNTSTTTEQGFSAQAYVSNQLADDPEARASQAAGVLYPALMQAIASPV